MPKTQDWLDKNYPQEIRSSVKNLLLRGKQLEGELDLREFINLEKLDCCFNQLTSLNLTGLKNLKVLYANDNLLTNLDYSSLDPTKLTGLIIDNNNLSDQDIAIFGQFINLEDLRIGSDDYDKIQVGCYNRFFGSLKSFRNLTRLEDLGINNTDINEGMEHLPSNVRKIRYSTTRLGNKLQEIIEQLNFFLNQEVSENWQDIHPQFTEAKEREWKDNYFSYQGTRHWIEVGLHPNDVHLVSYLKAKGYQPSLDLDLENLIKEDQSAQKYLEEKYSSVEKEWESWLDIGRSGLEGDLVIKDWANLERLDCYSNQLTSLTIINCPKLTRIECSNNLMNNLTINNCSALNYLNISDNLLNNLDFLTNIDPQKIIVLYITNNDFSEQDISIFSKFVNLKNFYLANNNFTGNLQSLKDLTNLEKLGISGTQINEDLEYLPDDLKEVALASNQELGSNTSGFKIVRWTNLLKEKEYSNIAYYDLQYWKEAQPAFQKLKESWEKLNPGQNIWDFLKRENIFFNVRLGNFQANDSMLISFLQKDQIINEKEKEIIKLRKVIAEISGLREVISEKEKVIINKIQSTYPNEKELLENLVQSYAKLKQAESKKITDSDEIDELEEKCEEISNKLKKVKVERKFIREIKQDCEELVQLEANISEFQEQSKQIVNVMISNSSINVQEGNVFLGGILGDNTDLSYSKQITYNYGLGEEQFNQLMERLDSIEQTIETKNQAIEEESKEQIIQLEINQELTDQEKELIKEVINFLDSRKIFLNIRQGTIQSLQECCSKYEQANTVGTYAIIDDVSDITSNVGEIVDPLISASIHISPVKAVGGIMKSVNNLFKKKSLSDNSKKIQEILVTDKRSILFFDEYYTNLTNSVWSDEENEIVKAIIGIFSLKKNKTSFFSEHDVFKVLTIWQGKKVITLEEMKGSIELLDGNWKNFKEQLEKEENKFQQRIGIKFQEDSNQLLQAQIQILPKY